MTIAVGRALVSDPFQHGVDHDDGTGTTHTRGERGKKERKKERKISMSVNIPTELLVAILQDSLMFG